MICNVLITGAHGFSARALTEILSDDNRFRLFFSDIRPDSSLNEYTPCNLSHQEETRRLIEKTQPDQIYHLAGAFTNDYETDLAANLLTTKNIFDALLSLGRRTRVLLVGSAAEYGNAASEIEPIAEDHPLLPVSIYGLTKVFQTQLMKYYFRTHGLDLVMARPFNLFGAGISNRLFVGKVYEQIQDYLSGVVQKIEVGNLEGYRDYLHVQSAVSDYRVIMEKGHSGEIYNVASGQKVKVANVLDRMLMEAGLDSSVVEEKNCSLSPIANSFANISKLRQLKAGATVR